MKLIKTLSILVVSTSLVSACTVIEPEAYYSRGNPESLLDQSSEIVNFELSSYSALDDLTEWVNQDQPSRAELKCMEGDSMCMEAEQILGQFGVPTVFVASADNTATLIYERILARDCENRYIDNSINPYNLPHPSFGCSSASNMVQMVTDKRQFTSPALLDYSDAERLDRVMTGYRQPYNVTAPNIDPNFDVQLDIQTNSN